VEREQLMKNARVKKKGEKEYTRRGKRSSPKKERKPKKEK